MRQRHTFHGSLPLRPVLAAVAVMMGMLAMSSCSSASESSTSNQSQSAAGEGAPQSGGDISFARLSSNVTSLDPHDDVLITINAYTLDKVFDTLYALDAQGIPQPSLATDHTVSEDGLTWTFKIREDVKFSDGTDFGAEDVVYSLNRHLEKGGALPLSAPITSVEASDPHTVVIALSEPYTPLLSELSIFSSSILPNNLAGKAEDEFFADPIGTGPFIVQKWDKSTGEFVLGKNTNYWQEGLPYLDTITLVNVDDDNQLVQQIQAGQADIVDDVPIANVAELEASPSVNVLSVSSWNQDRLFFNNAEGAFTDQHLRRAVAQAIDVRSLAQVTSFDTAIPAGSYLPTTITYSDQSVGALPFDVDAAKAELAQSSYKGEPVTLTVEGGSQVRGQQAQIIQSALADIGINAEIETVDSATFWAQYPAGDYDFALSTVIADTGDPDNFSTWHIYGKGTSQSFFTGYNNDEVNELIEKGRITPDGPERAEIYRDIQEQVAADAPALSLDYIPEIKATTSAVHGLELIPNGTVRLERVWIER